MPRVGGGVPGDRVGALVRVATGFGSGVMTSGGTLSAVEDGLAGKFFTALSTETGVTREAGKEGMVVGTG